MSAGPFPVSLTVTKMNYINLCTSANQGLTAVFYYKKSSAKLYVMPIYTGDSVCAISGRKEQTEMTQIKDSLGNYVDTLPIGKTLLEEPRRPDGFADQAYLLVFNEAATEVCDNDIHNRSVVANVSFIHGAYLPPHQTARIFFSIPDAVIEFYKNDIDVDIAIASYALGQNKLKVAAAHLLAMGSEEVTINPSSIETLEKVASGSLSYEESRNLLNQLDWVIQFNWKYDEGLRYCIYETKRKNIIISRKQ